MSSKESQRLEKTFKKFLLDHKSKFDHIDDSNRNIETQLNTIKETVYKSIRENCKDQFVWLDQHATVNFNDNGINIHVNENPDGITADAVLGQLDVCASQNDQGLKEFFNSANKTKEIILKENQRCINTCTFRSEDKTDGELKNCIQTCFMKSFDTTEGLLSKINDKISNVKKNLELL